MNFIQNKFEYDSTVKNGRQEVFAEGDVIVPDTEPDILSVYQLDGNAVVTDITPADGKISVFGKAFINILYDPESETSSVCCIKTKLDFSARIDNALINADTKYIFDYDISSVEYQIINSRKLRIKVCISLGYIIKQPLYAMLPVEGDGTQPLNFIKESVCVNNILEAQYPCFDIQETFELDAGQPSAAHIIKSTLEVTEHEHKLAGGKIIFRCVCTLTVLYLDSNGEYVIWEKQFPFSDICAIDTEDENVDTSVSFYVGDAVCEAPHFSDGDTRTLNLTAQLYAAVAVSRRCESEYISDCYISGTSAKPSVNNINVTEDCGCETREINLREALSPPEGKPAVSRIYKVSASPSVSACAFDSGKCTVSGTVEIYVSYLAADNGGIYCFSKSIPFEQTIDAGSADMCSATPYVKHCSYSVNASGSVDVRVLLELKTELQKNKTLVITEELKESSDTPARRGIRIYFAKNGETMWDIGKKFLVSTDILDQYNPDAEADGTRRIIVPML